MPLSMTISTLFSDVLHDVILFDVVGCGGWGLHDRFSPPLESIIR